MLRQWGGGCCVGVVGVLHQRGGGCCVNGEVLRQCGGVLQDNLVLFPELLISIR